MNRTSTVLRLHLASPRGLVQPTVIGTTIAWSITLAAGGVARLFNAGPSDLAAMNRGMLWSGAIWSCIGGVIAVAVIAMNQTLDLALGLGLTRREYARGTGLLMAASCSAITVFITVLKVIEGQTGGWGLGVRMFDVVWVNAGAWWQTAVQTFLVCALMLGLGGALTGVFRRWGSSGVLLALAAALAVSLVVGALALVAPPVRSALQTTLSWPWPAWMAVLAAAAALLGLGCWAFIRRAEVR